VLPEWWHYGPEARPARSLVPAIAPIGLGTPLCEDIASYVSRLAWEQGRAPVRLVKDVLAPALATLGGAPDPEGWIAEFERVVRHPTASIVGHAAAAATWADAIEAATGLPGARSMTLLAWANVIPRKGGLRSERAWCSICLEEARLAGSPIYAPLLWQFSEVTMCPRHEVRLSTHCPDCGRSAGVLTAWARVGICPCGVWLGRPAPGEDEVVGGDELDWQRFVTSEIGSLIAATPRLPEPPTAGGTAGAVRACWKRTGLSLTALSKALGMSLATVSLWKDGRRQPSLPGALRLCRVAGVDIVSFLRGDLETIAAAPISTEIPYVRPSDETHRQIDWESVRLELEASLTALEPSSLASVLRHVDVDNRQAKREFPQLCSAIASRFRAASTERAANTRAAEVQLVRDVIAVLHREGVYASRHQVQKRLPRSVSLRQPYLHQIWAEEARDPSRRFFKA